MDAFNFVFTLFGLLLGFTLVEVLAGLARVLKAHRRIRIGWLTPMLAIFVMMDVLSFWSVAWGMRLAIAPTYSTLLFGLAFAGAYYLAASLIFPDDLAETPDLDVHYAQVHRLVLSCILACNLIQEAFSYRAVMRLGPSVVALVGIYFVCLGGALVAQRRGPSVFFLAALIVIYIVNAAI